MLSPLSLFRFYLVSLWCLVLMQPCPALAQQAPANPSKVWAIEPTLLLHSQVTISKHGHSELETDKPYTLAELINLAEERNPKTRVAWEKAKQFAARLGIAKSELFPTLAAVSTLENDSTAMYFWTYYKQNLYLFRPAIELTYTVLDFGERRARIDEEKAALLAANLNFNEAHRQVIYDTVSAYYNVMLAISRKRAAEVTLFNAKTVQEAVEERLVQGLATLPDKLDAQAATAKAEYELASVQGEEEIARGKLASILRESPLVNIKLENLSETTNLDIVIPSAQHAIEEALHFRPDFLAKIQRIDAAQAEIKLKRAAYFPKLTISANYGRLAAYASQDYTPFLFGQVPVYQIEAKFRWVLFDAGRRRNELNLAKAHYAEAVAEEQELKDQVEFQVWKAFVNVQTAKKQLQAAKSQLTASLKSYEAATEAYHYGVRHLIDVTTAQKNLAVARNNFVEARIRLLADVAELAFQTGDLVHIGNPARSSNE
ncbi:MAG: outer rane efflux protein [Vampirovibrio sp.]|nr:outer rane efflux protein [Vampirovibrio sp.]